MPFDIRRFAFPVLATALVLSFLLTARRLSAVFPTVNPDEVGMAVNAYHFSRGEGIKYSLYDDLFAPNVYAYRDLSNSIGRPAFVAWMSLFARHDARSHWTMRQASVLAGSLAFVFLLVAGWKMAGRIGAAAAGLTILVNPVFWLGSTLLNECILLIAVFCGVLALGLWAVDRSWWAMSGCGFLLGLALLVHPHVVLLIPGFAIVMMRSTERPRLPILGALAIGLLAGALLAVSFIDLKRFVLSQRLLYGAFVKPPFLSWPWSPIGWFRQSIDMLASGPSYYLQAPLAGGWRLALRLFAAGSLVVGALTMVPAVRRAKGVVALWSAVLVTFVLMALFIARSEVLYALWLAPFVALAAGATAKAAIDAGRAPRVVLAAAALICLGAGIVFAGFARDYKKRTRPFLNVMQGLRRALPSEAQRVAGPSWIWFSREPYDIRDLGATVISRFYTGGQSDLRGWLARWRPDALVADETFMRVHAKGDPSGRALADVLHLPVAPIGIVQAGPGYGPWVVFKLEWPIPAP
jgi:hypothetical protein